MVMRPERHDCRHCRGNEVGQVEDQEGQEVAVVSMAETVVYERAMVIKFLHTALAEVAVEGAT